VTKANIGFFFPAACMELFRRNALQVPELAATFVGLSTRAKAVLLWAKPVFHFVAAVVVGLDRSFIVEVGQSYDVPVEQTTLTIAAILCKNTALATDTYLAVIDLKRSFYVLSVQALKQMVVESKSLASKKCMFASEDEFAQMVLDGCSFLSTLQQEQFTTKAAVGTDGKMHTFLFKSHFGALLTSESAKKMLKLDEPPPAVSPVALTQETALSAAIAAGITHYQSVTSGASTPKPK
jgi:hypothetical protein